MNKFFPQVLKAEESIQALRCELRATEAESAGQKAELSQADRQIRDLHGNLGQVERDQLDLVHDMGQTELESAELRNSLREASEERDELKEMLQRSELDQLRGYGMLSEMAQVLERERLIMRDKAELVSQRSEQFGSAEDETSDFRCSILEVNEEEANLRQHLERQATHEELQSAELNSARCEFSQQHTRAMKVGQEVKELRERMMHLEQAGQEARTNLSSAEVTEQDNRANRLELTILREEQAAVDQRIEELEGIACKFEAQLAEMRKDSEATEAHITGSEKARDSAETELLEGGTFEAKSRVELIGSRRECDDLRVTIEQTSEVSEVREQGLQWDLLERRKLVESLQERRKQIETKSQKVQEQHTSAEDECMTLHREAEQLEMDAEELRTSSAELEQAKAELRKRLSCCVC